MKIQNVWGKAIVLGLVTFGALVILVFYYQTAGGRLPTAEKRYSIKTEVAEPQQLLKHADVRAAGVKVGEVAAIDGSGAQAVLTLDLEKEIAPVYRDATVLVRQKTLVGENYVEVKRGTPGAGVLPTGSTLPKEASREAVPIDRVLNSLDKETRTAISENLRALGGGVDGRGTDINRFVTALRPLVIDGVKVTDVLNAQREQVADLIAQGGTVFEAVADRREDLTSLLRAARTTAETVSTRDEQLKSAFDEFPSTLQQARGSVQRLSGFSGRAVPVLADLRQGLVDLKPVIDDLRPTAQAATTLLDELPRFTNQADPLLEQVKRFTKIAGPTFPAADAFLRQVNPALAYLKPFNRDVANTLSAFGSFAYYDKFGAQGICQCPIGQRSFANYTPAMREVINILTENAIVGTALRDNNDHYRRPGTAPRADSRFTGKYPQLLSADGEK